MSGFDEYYELRIYRGTPGRMADLHHRFGFEARPLFDRHGATRPLGYWEGHAGPFAPAYVYLHRWDSLDQRFEAFGKFYADPDWNAQRIASNAGAHMIDRADIMFLRPSPAWDAHRPEGEPEPVGGLHELCFLPLNTQDAAEGQRVFGEIDLPFLASRGAEVLGVFQVWFGWTTPQLVYFLAWDSFDARDAAMTAYQRDPDIGRQRMHERQTYGGPLHFAGDTMLLEPARYGMPVSGLSGPAVKTG